MLSPRDLSVRRLAVGLLAVCICAAGAGSCHGPDTFLRNDGSGGQSLGGFTGQLGGSGGLGGAGGVPGLGGSGLGGSGLGGSGVGGMAAAGGRPGTGGSADAGTGVGGRMGTGGASDGGTIDAPGTDGMIGTGGAPGTDAAADGVVATGPCAGRCANPIVFTTRAYSSGDLGAGATCHETTIAISGGNCGNFVAPRTFTVNGTAFNCVSGGNWVPPAPVNGGYCMQASPGAELFAYFVTF